MKTMLGGWEDVQGSLAHERAARAGSAEPLASLHGQRCVVVSPKDCSSQASAARRFSLRKTRVGGVSVPLPPLPAAERLAPRPGTRQPAFTRPAPGPALAVSPGAPASARLALDETCEIRDVDLVLLMDRPGAPQPSVARVAAGLRRGGTLIDPELRVIPLPTAGQARYRPSLVRRFVHWLKARLFLR